MFLLSYFEVWGLSWLRFGAPLGSKARENIGLPSGPSGAPNLKKASWKTAKYGSGSQTPLTPPLPEGESPSKLTSPPQIHSKLCQKQEEA